MDLIKGLRPGTAGRGSSGGVQTLSKPLALDQAGAAPETFLAATLAAVVGRYLSCDEVVLALESEEAGEFAELAVPVSSDEELWHVLRRIERASAGGDGPEETSSSAGAQLLAHIAVCAPGALGSESERPWRLRPKNVEFNLANVDCAFAWDAEGAELLLAFAGSPLEAPSMEVLLESAVEAATAAAASLAAERPLQIAQLPLVPPPMREKIMREFNDTSGPLAAEETVLSLIESQIAAHPGNTAYIFEDRSLLLVSNSLELPVAILACLKLGAVFIPMDEMWPEERLESLLRDTDPRAVIATDPSKVPEEIRDRVLSPAPESQDPRLELAAEKVGPTDLIYGIPTSGSTGPPKCSLNIHRGLVNRFQYMTRRYRSGSHEVSLQNSRPAFDSSLWQLLWPLTNGATVVIPRLSKQLDLAHTIELIHRHRITMTDFVPSVFNTLVRHLEQAPEDVERLRSLQNLLIGGEEINPNYCHRRSGWCSTRLTPRMTVRYRSAVQSTTPKRLSSMRR